ncbi:hypothetical protein AGMMS49975_16970 [Clostridia bacterium]|nr:hypothetical protein AGMMS49975_16970 [Clostridia bacterium]
MINIGALGLKNAEGMFSKDANNTLSVGSDGGLFVGFSSSFNPIFDLIPYTDTLARLLNSPTPTMLFSTTKPAFGGTGAVTYSNQMTNQATDPVSTAYTDFINSGVSALQLAFDKDNDIFTIGLEQFRIPARALIDAWNTAIPAKPVIGLFNMSYLTFGSSNLNTLIQWNYDYANDSFEAGLYSNSANDNLAVNAAGDGYTIDVIPKNERVSTNRNFGGFYGDGSVSSYAPTNQDEANAENGFFMDSVNAVNLAHTFSATDTQVTTRDDETYSSNYLDTNFVRWEELSDRTVYRDEMVYPAADSWTHVYIDDYDTIQQKNDTLDIAQPREIFRIKTNVDNFLSYRVSWNGGGTTLVEYISVSGTSVTLVNGSSRRVWVRDESAVSVTTTYVAPGSSATFAGTGTLRMF